MFKLLLDSITLIPMVFVRTFPVALVLSLLYFGFIYNTDSALWRVIFAAILGLPFIAIMRIATLRAALVAIGRTGPPTFNNLMRAQMRLAYGNLFPIYMVLMVVLGLMLNFLAITVMDTTVVDFATSTDPDALQEEVLGNPQVFLLVNAFTLLYYLILAVGFGAMGTPMAVTCANAAEKSPRHDITFGFAFNFWKLFALYFVGNMMNTLFMLTLGLLTLSLVPFLDANILFFVAVAGGLIYVSLCFATTASGAAISYGELLDREAEIREIIQASVGGPQTSSDELRAMRQARQATPQ